MTYYKRVLFVCFVSTCLRINIAITPAGNVNFWRAVESFFGLFYGLIYMMSQCWIRLPENRTSTEIQI